MSATVRDAGPFEKLVTFSVSEAEIEAAKNRTARRLSKEVQIRGFRPGKAPRRIVEATVGRERLRSEAIDDLLPDKLGTVLEEIELAPAVTPRLEQLDETDDGVEVEVRVTLWPELAEVPELAGRRIEVGSVEVAPEEVAETVDRLRRQFARLEPVERPAAAGDFVAIDIRATRQGEDVPEARATQLLYEVGSGGFVEGIDEALMGAEPGSTVTFDGVLPEGFGDMTGWAVSYEVRMTEVREPVLPALTDEWVSEVTEFTSVAELEVNVEQRLEEVKRRTLAARFRRLALDELVDQVEVDLPEGLVQEEANSVLHRFLHRLEREDVTLDDYLRVTGISQEALIEDLRAQGERNLRTRLLLEAVAHAHGLEVSEAELANVVEAMADASEDPARVRRLLREEVRANTLLADILRNKALDLIVAGAVPVDGEGNPVDLSVDVEPVEAEIVEDEPSIPVTGDVVTGIVEAEIVETGEEQ